jgi:hypothetical protein
MTIGGGNNLDGLYLRHGVDYPNIRVVHIHVMKEKRTELEPSSKKVTFADTEYLIWRSIVRSRRLRR